VVAVAVGLAVFGVVPAVPAFDVTVDGLGMGDWLGDWLGVPG
jgi:hypothetical protein